MKMLSFVFFFLALSKRNNVLSNQTFFQLIMAVQVRKVRPPPPLQKKKKKILLIGLKNGLTGY